MTIPRINTADAELHLGDDIYFTEADLLEGRESHRRGQSRSSYPVP